MYSPETLLQLHHLRHDELVAAAAHARANLARPVDRAPGPRDGLLRLSRAATARTRRLVAALRVATANRRAPAGSTPVCCPA